jgi:hypothetical protein
VFCSGLTLRTLLSSRPRRGEGDGDEGGTSSSVANRSGSVVVVMVTCY